MDIKKTAVSRRGQNTVEYLLMLTVVVGVVLDTMKQLESHLLMRHYEGFMRSGHLRGRR